MAVTFNYTAHAAQRCIHASRGYRFRTVCCGRRFGKTRFAAAELLDLAGEHGGTYAWIAPTYFLCEKGENALQEIAGDYIMFSGSNPRRGSIAGRAQILFLSADHPEMILGEGYNGAVVDEAASIDGAVWQKYIRPALADKLGWAIFISTPKGRNWFFDLFTLGREKNEPGYKSFTFPSNKNPYFPESEWEEAKHTTPADIFRQEYEAEFLEDSAGVFHNIEACLVEKLALPTAEVVIGCDVAKHIDFTVLIAMDSRTGQCIDIERFNRLDWPIQKERIVAFARKQRGRLILDATGAGDPIYDDLVRVYPNITPFRFTAHSKVELIQRLVVVVEQRRVTWPRAWEVLTNEMKRFEYRLSPSGQLSYSAPEGYHDDCVISLALANGYRQEYGQMGLMLQLNRPILDRQLLPMLARLDP